MREFFKPWRRKIGVVTLGLACVLTAAWMRSYPIRDTISLSPRSYWRDEIESRDGSLGWFRFTLSPTGPEFEAFDVPMSFSSNNNRVVYSPSSDETLVWHWKWAGFGSGAGPTHLVGMKAAVWAVPYWSVVLSVALLSAYLLLVKPRPETKPGSSMSPEPDHA